MGESRRVRRTARFAAPPHGQIVALVAGWWNSEREVVARRTGALKKTGARSPLRALR